MSNQPNKTNGAKPAVRKKKNLLDDRRVRLALSVLGAIVAWMVVTIIVQPGTTNTIYNVPVDYTYDSAAYTSRGLSIVNAEDKTVNLKLSGDGYTIGGLSASDFVVYPDWSSVRDSGEKTLRLLVRGANGLLNGVTVTMEAATTRWTWYLTWWRKRPCLLPLPPTICALRMAISFTVPRSPRRPSPCPVLAAN